MDNINAIEKQIRSLRDPSPEKIFKILKPVASDFRQHEIRLGLIPGFNKLEPGLVHEPDASELESAVKAMQDHPFLCWLNTKEGFVKTKKRIAAANLVAPGQSRIGVIRQHTDSTALAYLCALIIYYFTCDGNKLSQVIVHANKRGRIHTAIQKLHRELKEGGIYFSYESKQQLLLHLLDDLIEDTCENIFSSKKYHPMILRQIITKKLIHSLLKAYGCETMSHVTAVDVALDLSSVFFPCTMDRGVLLSRRK